MKFPNKNPGDPSPFIEQSGGLGSGSEFPVGSTTETFTATDATGNFESGSFHVEVMDDQDPDMTPVPADIIVNTAPGQCTAVVTFATPTATDNCPGAMIDLTAGKESGSTFDLGVTAQTFTATDASGNSLSDIFHVVVKDNENPGITGLPSSSTHGNDAGQCGAVVNYAAPTATDNCPPATIARTSGPSSGDLFPVGATPVTFTATDSSSNTFSDTFTVQVNDDEPPVPSVPANIVVNNDAGLCGADVSYATPTATDNCAVASVVQTSGSGPGSFPVGPATTETWTATDVFGNVASSSFTVKVNDVEDPSAPIVPANIVVNNDAGKCGADMSYATPTATDNCAVMVTLTSGSGPGSFSVGPATTETWTATDDAGNTASSSFTVQVNDNEPPVPSVPANIVVSNDAGVCGADVSYVTPTATDNCAVDSVVQTSGSGPGSFSVGPATTETWTATDNAGNTASSSFTVQVNDDEPPVPSVPANIVVNNDAGLCGADVSYATPTATDNCAVASVVQTSGSGPGSFPVGPATTETWTATDVFGNVASSSFTVKVNDVEDPSAPIVPANIVVNNDAGKCGADVSYATPTATDNCAVMVTLTSESGPGSFSVGPATTETWTATDDAGNTASSSFTVQVNDNEPPVPSVPANIVVSNDAGKCLADVSYVTPTATDNCAVDSVVQTSGSGSGSFSVGPATTETWTATDNAGNTASSSFTVQVNDDEPPVPSVPANIVVNNDAGLCGADVSYATPTATDNCAVASVVQTSGSGPGSFPVGPATTETWTATDVFGNVASSSFTVKVNDVEDPSAPIVPANIVVNNDAGKCGADVSYATPTATDNCAVMVTLTSGSGPGSFSVGPATTETWTATDDAGNTASSSFTVQVNDNEPPVPSVPANIVVSNDAGKCLADVSYVTPTATDNCAVDSVVLTSGSGNDPGSFSVGPATTETWTATDVFGNTASSSSLFRSMTTSPQC